MTLHDRHHWFDFIYFTSAPVKSMRCVVSLVQPGGGGWGGYGCLRQVPSSGG